jgi:hypothetical protein
VAWGLNIDGQTTVPAGLDNVVQIAAGWMHTVVVRSDGTVVAWGNNDYGQCTVPPDLSGVVRVAAGAHHTVALRADGSVVAWGRNDMGQTSVPPGLENVIQIATGNGDEAQHTVALRDDGTVVAWGANSDGQVDVPPDTHDVVYISAGDRHSLALYAIAPTSEEPPSTTGRSFTIWSPAPNPVRGTVAIRFSLRQAAAVRLTIVDGLGRTVAEVHGGQLEAGAHVIHWDGSVVPAGVYAVRLVGPYESAARPFTVSR